MKIQTQSQNCFEFNLGGEKTCQLQHTITVITFPSLCTTNSKPSFKEYKHKYLLVSQPYSVSFYALASIFVQTKQAFIVLIFSTPSPDNQ